MRAKSWRRSWRELPPILRVSFWLLLGISVLVVISVVLQGRPATLLGWVLLSVAAAAGLIHFAGPLLDIYERAAKSTDHKVHPAEGNELLIIVTKFRGPASIDPQHHISTRLETDLKKHPSLRDRVRVERLAEYIDESNTAAESERAAAIGKRYRATLVIWGRHDDYSITAHYRVTPERLLRVIPVWGERTILDVADLDELTLYVLRYLPQTLSCASFFTIGQMHYVAKDYTHAIELFDACQSLLDKLPPAAHPQQLQATLAFYRGVAYDEKGDHDLAIADFTHAVKHDPGMAPAYTNRGIAYAQQGKQDLAIRDYDHAIEHDPSLAPAYNNRGLAYAQQGEHSLAIQDYARAIERAPDLAHPYYNRGVSYVQKGDHDQAIKDFTHAIERDPTLAPAYNNRGLAYAQQGEHCLAIQDYARAIERAPELAHPYYNRGISYTQKGDHDRAIKDFTQAIERAPESAQAYTNRGLAYAQQGKQDLAIRDYDHAIERAPELALAH